jgi:hypothetical protein
LFGNKKAKVNAEAYLRHLNQHILPNFDQLYPDGDYIFQQDGATSQTAKSTHSYLTKRLGKARFLKSYEWPPSLPDLNLLDYYFWDALSKKVYEGRRGRPF